MHQLCKLRNESLESLIDLSNIQWKKQDRPKNPLLPASCYLDFKNSALIFGIFLNSQLCKQFNRTFFFLTFWSHCTAHGILVHQSGIESAFLNLEM